MIRVPTSRQSCALLCIASPSGLFMSPYRAREAVCYPVCHPVCHPPLTSGLVRLQTLLCGAGIHW